MVNPCDGCLVAPMCSAACEKKLWQKKQIEISKDLHLQASITAPNQMIRRSYQFRTSQLTKKLNKVSKEIAKIRMRNIGQSGLSSGLSSSSSSSSSGGSTCISTPSGRR